MNCIVASVPVTCSADLIIMGPRNRSILRRTYRSSGRQKSLIYFHGENEIYSEETCRQSVPSVVWSMDMTSVNVCVYLGLPLMVGRSLETYKR